MKSLVGQKRHRWTVIGEGHVERRPNDQIRWVVARCDCGTERTVRWSQLIAKAPKGSQSCGCYKQEKALATAVPIEERFWIKVQVIEQDPDACWEWQAYRNPLGYGVVGTSQGQTALAHRVAYELHHGVEIPAGQLVCHTCDNPGCCRPDHLWAGTNADNMADMVAKGRGRAPKGTASPNAKLAEDDVRSIRQRYAAGNVTQQALADEYGVTQRVISLIVLNRSYTEVI